jgi:hypothetical protein
MLAPAMRRTSALAALRRVEWRRFGAALALAALLVQGLLVALHLQAHAAAAPWDDPAVICHSDDGGAPGTADDGDGRQPACPLCQALHHVAKALPPSDAFILLPPPVERVALVQRSDDTVGRPVPRPNLPRGPPTSG